MEIFDCHFHIIDHRFPLAPGYLPEEFTCADYAVQAKALGITGGALVSGSFQGFDQTYLTAALERLGPAFVGVTQLPAATTDEELVRLQRAGVRAVRFNLRRGGSAGVEDLESFARRVYDRVGWHVELYAEARELSSLYPVLTRLPAVVIDHLGLSRSGLPILLKLVERGVYVKATGFGRLDFEPGPVIRDLARANPDALMFGTDLPSTRAPHPFQKQDLDLIAKVLDTGMAEKVLHHNAVALYRPAGGGKAGRG